MSGLNKTKKTSPELRTGTETIEIKRTLGVWELGLKRDTSLNGKTKNSKIFNLNAFMQINWLVGWSPILGQKG